MPTDALSLNINDYLPPEVLQQIFSYLNLQEILNVKKVEKQLWLPVAKTPALWRDLVGQYFPRLVKEQETQYKNDPQQLFQDALKNAYNKFKHSSIKPYILLSLRGEIDKIEKLQIGHNEQQALYFVAARNGHFAGLRNMDTAEKAKLLQYAVRKGDLDVIKALLAERAELPSSDATIATFTKISSKDISAALCGAVRKDHNEILIELLTQVGNEISSKYKGIALITATENNFFTIVQTLLTYAGNSLENKALSEALSTAAANGYLEIVKALLAHAGDKIYTEDKELALLYAAQNNHPAIYQELLANASNQISIKNKSLAKKYIKKHAISEGGHSTMGGSGRVFVFNVESEPLKAPKRKDLNAYLHNALLPQKDLNTHEGEDSKPLLHQYPKRKKIRKSEITLLLKEAEEFVQKRSKKM